MFEKFCGNALLADSGRQHQSQTPTGALPVGNLLALRQPKNVFPAIVALFPRHVFVAFEEPRPQNVPGGIR